MFTMYLKRITKLSTFVLLAAITNLFADEVSQSPLFLVDNADPKVMLTMSNDHQLFIKAYTDYTDLDSDGLIDTTYLDTIDYFGYFENNQCYQYNSSQQRFNARQVATGANGHSCSFTNRWSGNFLNWISMTRIDIIRKVLYGGFRSRDNTNNTILERAYLPNDSHAFAKVFTTDTSAEMLEFTPFSQTEVSFCNVTFDNDSSETLSGKISTTSSPPLIRAASGEFPRWASSEIHQCAWGSGSSPSYSNRVSQEVSTGDYVARVRVCQRNLDVSDCTQYPSGNYKPNGILQENSSADGQSIDFGLMTGSYGKNRSGGVLRKNILPMLGNNNFDDEYDENTGRFNYIRTSLSDEYEKGIIQTLDSLRIAGWHENSSKHLYGCDFPGNTHINNGECVDWGNPLSEIYLETLRYFSGKSSPSSDFYVDDSTYIPGLLSATWQDPISEDQFCADLSNITISTGLNSFDTDELDNDINIDIDVWTNAVGSQEGVNGSYLIGSNSPNSTNNTSNQCTAKNLSSLSDASGICPEMPSLEGGYDIAGLAYYARVNDLRDDREGDQKLTSYGVALAESLPRFDVPVGSGTISILPACQARTNNSNISTHRSCSILDVTVLELNSAGTKGSFDIIWEDTSWGNDYDVDGIAHISFCVADECDTNPGANKLSVTASLRQIGAGHGMKFGYVITGSTNDGVYLDVDRVPGGANFNYTTTPSSSLIDTNTFSPGTSSANQLENPLWYMAKYGSFNESGSGTAIPDQIEEWDVLPEGAPDGRPDGYFQATNPALLQESLNQVFDDIASRRAGFASVASSSTSLTTDTELYLASFDSGDWSGSLSAFPINATTGDVGESLWDAAELIPDAINRNIFSYNTDSDSAINFLHNNLSSQQKSLLTEDQVNYIRGDTSKEGIEFRERSSLLGDIVNSSPLFVGQANFNYYNMSGYEEYLAEEVQPWRKIDRQKMLYAGANDGMLHAFIAEGDTSESCDVASQTCEGEEAFSYIPKAVFSNLAALTETDYQHQFYVNNSPTYSDAEIRYESGDAIRWGTVLVSTLGAGGKGIFALDISNPTNFTTNDVLWDKDDSDTGYENLGYTFSEASIVKMANGKWAAIIGNGYNSQNYTASLLILDLQTGDVIKEISAGTQGSALSPNGLSTPVAIDTDNDSVIDIIYAGDLYGNLWKFDVSDTSTSNWEIAIGANSDEPLFTACTSYNNDGSCDASSLQAITAQPQVIRSTTGEYLILFGTGSYYTTDDRDPGTQVHSYYGITDTDTQVLSRNSLLQQQIITSTAEQADTTATFVSDFRVTTDNAIDFTTHRGWYLDFDDPSYVGERVVTQALATSGFVLFNTIIPETNACTDGLSFIMVLDAQSGARSAGDSFDLTGDSSVDADDKVKIDSNGDGNIDGGDSAIATSGISTDGVVGGVTKLGNTIYTNEAGIAGSSGGIGSGEVGLDADRTGRMSWNQLK